MTEGWKCPVCSRGVAPSEKFCNHGNYIGWSVPQYPLPSTTVPSWPISPTWYYYPTRISGTVSNTPPVSTCDPYRGYGY